jgi:cysteine synthase
MRSANAVWEAVGDTPLIRIASLSDITGNEIYGKAELLNPGGSIKDRAARGIIQAAEQDGSLQPGGTIVEGTAGNTGIGLATLAAERGYRVIIVMPDNQAAEKYQLLEALGAEVRAVPACPFKDPAHFYHTAKRVAARTEGALWADQFENPANATAHYETTGPEIWAQTNGEVDMLVAASGTGGTIGGTSAFLKEQNAEVRVTLIDPPGSGLASYVRTGAFSSEGSSVTEGIGIMRLTANFGRAVVDDALQASDQQMVDMLFHVARHDGLFLGTSSALNLVGALHLGLEHKGQGKKIVTFLCDSGSRYASKLLDKGWQEEKDLTPRSLEV